MTRTITSDFSQRHIGPSPTEKKEMLNFLGKDSVDSLIKDCVPKNILSAKKLDLKPAATESDALAELKSIINKNEFRRSFIGTGYSNCLVPSVIKRLILENPGWYTQYTPYQAEIAQGRLEALINFQTFVTELTGLPIANASLLDESTAAAEAMILSYNSRLRTSKAKKFFVSSHAHPQTLSVLKTRATPLGIELVVDNEFSKPEAGDFFGALFQYPQSNGHIDSSMKETIELCHSNGIFVTLCCDILALTVLESPGQLGADIAVGTTQRFGVPMGFGGPHAAYFATSEALKRKIPGRIVGVSKDKTGKPAYRLALQTREQHIRRDKATSNICTSQVLLAIMSSMYAVYHGPKRLKKLALEIFQQTANLHESLSRAGVELESNSFFDTLTVKTTEKQKKQIISRCDSLKINLRTDVSGSIGVSLDETTTDKDLRDIFFAITGNECDQPEAGKLELTLARSDEYMRQPVFNQHHTETEMMRYIKMLERKDLSLTQSMIPLGSCTMKLNSASSLYPVSWTKMGGIHPFTPVEQVDGYVEMIRELEGMLCQATGFDAVSLQPNSGAQGEYAGLLAIRSYHLSNGDENRNICLIPTSAHGTNPASAVMAGMKVVAVQCDSEGNIDVSDLEKKAELHKDTLAALMVTYPSTHGVFEESIKGICKTIHANGGQVYLDGANLNAQVGYCYPGDYGADVCHLNLHKTFSIPHGGGGPGVGPIGVKQHLSPFLPGHPVHFDKDLQPNYSVTSAPYGSAGILCIPWMYIRMLGENGLRDSSANAILNANYLAKRLEEKFSILFKGENGFVAHECIVDLRPFKKSCGIDVEDFAKRLMDYGYHAPTMSWPVAGTFMIEPTESESKAELDRFCEAMLSIYSEVQATENGDYTEGDNPLKNAPHTQNCIVKSDWSHAYSREKAAFPLPWVGTNKFWPSVTRIDNAAGDRNLVCTCPDMSEYES